MEEVDMKETLLSKPVSTCIPLSEFAVAKVFNIAPWRQRGAGWYSHILVAVHLAILLLAMTLVVFDAYQVALQMGEYFRFAGAVGCNVFLPSKCTTECANVFLAFERILDFEVCSSYSANQTVSSIQLVIDNYNDINITLANFQTVPSASSCGTDSYPYISVSYFVPTSKPTEYPLNTIEANDFVASLYTKGVLSSISLIQLHLPLLHQRSSMGLQATYLWRYIVDFHIVRQAKATISVSQRIDRVCDSVNAVQPVNLRGSIQSSYLYTILYYLRVTLIIACVCFLILVGKEFRDAWRLFSFAKQSLQRKKIEYSAAGSVDKGVGSFKLQSLGKNRPSDEDTHEPRRPLAYVQHLAPALLYGRPDVAKQFSDPGRPETSKDDSFSKDDGIPALQVDSQLEKLRHRSARRSSDESKDNGMTYSVGDTKMSATSLFQEHRLGHSNAHSAGDLKRIVDGHLMDTSESRIHESFVPDWEDLSIFVKVRLFDGWRILTTLGAVMVMCATISAFSFQSTGNEYSEATSMAMGVAVSMLLLSTVGYMRYSSQFTTAALIVGGAFLKIQSILVSALPFIMAFLMFGLIVFGAEGSGFFETIQKTIITLFSVMHSDSIWDTLQSSAPFNADVVGAPSYPEADILKSIFVFVFVVVFAYILLRILLAVIEGMYWYVRIYFKSRKKRNVYKRAIYEKLTIDRRKPQDATHKTAGQLLLRPTSEQLYVELLQIERAANQSAADSKKGLLDALTMRRTANRGLGPLDSIRESSRQDSSFSGVSHEPSQNSKTNIIGV